MPDGFDYESNALLLSEILVPDPVDKEAWDSAVCDWSAGSSEDSLLGYLLRHDIVEEKALLQCLQTATGAPFIGQTEGLHFRGETPPPARLLEKHGFTYHGHDGKHHLLTGGPHLPPRLDRFLGNEARNWQWHLAHPLRRTKPDSIAPETGNAETLAKGASLQWLEELLQALVSRGATDIHFERVEDTLTVWFHAGLRMQTAGQWTGSEARAALQLLRTRAGLAAASPELPLDGFIPIGDGTQTIAARLSQLRTINGESAVLRIPGRGVAVRSLPELGLPDDLIEACMDCVMNNPGLILCCGPTGSGKTTTLYGLLHDLSGKDLKILTIEDPVEQHLPNVVHCQVNVERHWDFPAAIRAFLRQDPDIIMVGEIRDAVSAAAACRAALSGHCVLSTLHARNEEAALHRLAAWGVGPGTIADSVRLVINQRLREDEVSRGLKPEFRWKACTPEATCRFLSNEGPGADQTPPDLYSPSSNPK